MPRNYGPPFHFDHFLHLHILLSKYTASNAVKHNIRNLTSIFFIRDDHAYSCHGRSKLGCFPSTQLLSLYFIKQKRPAPHLTAMALHLNCSNHYEHKLHIRDEVVLVRYHKRTTIFKMSIMKDLLDYFTVFFVLSRPFLFRQTGSLNVTPSKLRQRSPHRVLSQRCNFKTKLYNII